MIELIDLLAPDVLLLQEVYRADVTALSDGFETGVCSLDVPRLDGHLSGRVGCAVLARFPQVGKPELLSELPQPERGLAVTVDVNGRELDLVSWHAPNAAQRGREFK